jgi:phage shock protein PspC (stress-responsive transcriptional regulator)
MVVGVAGGIAQYVGVDPVLIRIIFVLLALFGGGGLLLYLICWLLIPEES